MAIHPCYTDYTKEPVPVSCLLLPAVPLQQLAAQTRAICNLTRTACAWWGCQGEPAISCLLGPPVRFRTTFLLPLCKRSITAAEPLQILSLVEGCLPWPFLLLIIQSTDRTLQSSPQRSWGRGAQSNVPPPQQCHVYRLHSDCIVNPRRLHGKLIVGSSTFPFSRSDSMLLHLLFKLHSEIKI